MVHGESADPGAGSRIPERRVVLLGASNLVAGLPRVVEAARSVWGGPLDILAAAGHGRSYGRSSRVLWRTLPGILSCGLWEDLARRPPASTAALLTDVGNDILYGGSDRRDCGVGRSVSGTADSPCFAAADHGAAAGERSGHRPLPLPVDALAALSFVPAGIAGRPAGGAGPQRSLANPGGALPRRRS